MNSVEDPILESNTRPDGAAAGHDGQPDWLVSELPPHYAEIARQIAELRQQARAYESVASVLWQTGGALTGAVAALFAALGFEAEVMGEPASFAVRVNLGEGRHLLVDIVAQEAPIDRRSPHIGRILRALQEDAGPQDRVVLVTNINPGRAPADRRDAPVAVDAVRLIQGLGANLVPTSTLFGLWKQSLQHPENARRSVMNLHAMDGGIFR